MVASDIQLSRAVAHALRHEPWLYEMELDEEGWASVDLLLKALREQGRAWASVDRGSLERMMTTAAKRRFELDGTHIRALYGHSVAGRVRKIPASPPARLYHGTTPETASTIKHEGLRPMRRQYVHLSVDLDTATAVGRRKSATPVVLEIDAMTSAVSEVSFYIGNDLVWLADSIPAQFIKFAGSSGVPPGLGED